MSVLLWLIPIALSFLSGIFLVNYLTVHPLEMSGQLLLAAVASFTAIAALAWKFRGKRLIAAIVLSLVAFSVGYALRTNAVLAREDTRELPQLTRAKGDPGDGHTAVIYFTHGEPKTYDPIGWLNQFREFDEQGIQFVPVFARPIFLYELRNKYLQVGQSHHHDMHAQMMQRVEEAVKADGYKDVKFYLAFLDDAPRPDAAVIQALDEGASQIVVAEVFVSISNHTAEGEDLIKGVKAEEFGIPVKYTGPLWNSQTLQQAFVDKANAAIGNTDKSKVGILLVGHGQPDEWDKEFPTETEQELRFREDILKLFAANGYRPENLSLAWMEFKQPQPTEKVEELAKNEVEKILYFSAAISADSIHSQSEVPEMVNAAKVPAGLLLINLGAWDDHPTVIQAIKEKIEPLLPVQAQATTR
jgi:protoheme ferro-lyase